MVVINFGLMFALVLLAGVSQAQQALDVGYFAVSTSPDAQEGDLGFALDLGAVSARYTHGLTPWLALEAAVSLGVRDDTHTLNWVGDPVDVTVAMDYGAMFNAKCHFALTDRVSVHAIAGYHHTQLTIEAQGIESSGDAEEEGVFGVGAEVRLFPGVWLRGDFLQETANTGTADFVWLGLSRKF